jgi:dUTP pyrophosphatase
VINIALKDEKLMPTVATEGAAGYDLRLAYGAVVRPGEKIKISTGVCFEIPRGHVGLLAPRSSTGKLDIVLANTLGFIDSDFRGEILVFIKNLANESQILYKYDILFQLVIVPVLVEPLNVQKSLSETARGSKGFGSSYK